MSNQYELRPLNSQTVNVEQPHRLRNIPGNVLRFTWLTLTFPIWAPKIVMYDIPKATVNFTSNIIKWNPNERGFIKGTQKFVGEIVRYAGNIVIGASLLSITGGIIEKMAIDVQFNKDKYYYLKFVPGGFWNNVQNRIDSAFSSYAGLFENADNWPKVERFIAHMVHFPTTIYENVSFNYPDQIFNPIYNTIYNSLLWVRVNADMMLPTNISANVDSAIDNFNSNKLLLAESFVFVSILALAFIPTKIMWDAKVRWRQGRNTPRRPTDSQQRPTENVRRDQADQSNTEPRNTQPAAQTGVNHESTQAVVNNQVSDVQATLNTMESLIASMTEHHSAEHTQALQVLKETTMHAISSILESQRLNSADRNTAILNDFLIKAMNDGKLSREELEALGVITPALQVAPAPQIAQTN